LYLLFAAWVLLFTHLSVVSSKLTDTNEERAISKDQFMSKSKQKLSPKLKVQKPVPVLFKLVEADFKDLFKALAKGVGHTATGSG